MTSSMLPHMPPYKRIDHPVYKYQIGRSFTIRLPVPDWLLPYYDHLPKLIALTDGDGVRWITLRRVEDKFTGEPLLELHARRGYAYDGGSGPAVDTMNLAMPFLVHDMLYQVIAEGLLPIKPWKKYADVQLVRLAKEVGASAFRRLRIWWGVRFGGGARDRFNPDGL